MTDKLTQAERETELADLLGHGWALHDSKDAITKTFLFADFVVAFGWMAQMALYAEKLNHHPEWFNVYKTVEVLLTTHDAGGLSKLDLELALRMDRAAAHL